MPLPETAGFRIRFDFTPENAPNTSLIPGGSISVFATTKAGYEQAIAAALESRQQANQQNADTLQEIRDKFPTA